MSEDLKDQLESGLRDALDGNVWGLKWNGDEVTVGHPPAMVYSEQELRFMVRASIKRSPSEVTIKRGRFVLKF